MSILIIDGLYIIKIIISIFEMTKGGGRSRETSESKEEDIQVA